MKRSCWWLLNNQRRPHREARRRILLHLAPKSMEVSWFGIMNSLSLESPYLVGLSRRTLQFDPRGRLNLRIDISQLARTKGALNEGKAFCVIKL